MLVTKLSNRSSFLISWYSHGRCFLICSTETKLANSELVGTVVSLDTLPTYA